MNMYNLDDLQLKAISLKINGVVQGVGFRPFIYRLAAELNLYGWVNNTSQGVFIEAEGASDNINIFLEKIKTDKPPLSLINEFSYSFIVPKGYTTFEIIKSKEEGTKNVFILPDSATCKDCLKEIFDPNNRRYLYPFTNCTNCGPRFSIINSLPYDRCNTSMDLFKMCPDCQNEYQNPLDRRFHAQPNACDECGPHVELWDHNRNVIASKHEAILRTAQILNAGGIIALKGVGGFQIFVNAFDNKSIKRLRELKHRDEKPFAMMFPSLEMIKKYCYVSHEEEKILTSPQAPIVLLKKKADSYNYLLLGESVTQKENPNLGVMLPYSPLHHILLKEIGYPVIATSGNISDEPICIDENEAVEILSSISDFFLVHNRPIVRQIDDSVVRVVLNEISFIRRARGYAPLPVGYETPENIIAVGGHFKNTIAVSRKNQIFLSQHIGDLGTYKSLQVFKKAISDFENMYDFNGTTVACDFHPDYVSTQYAKTMGKKLFPVQHHFAHALSCMAENGLNENVLGISWDGTGYGTDGTIWGGEFLRVHNKNFDRFAYFKPFNIPGGEKAFKKPSQIAIGLLYEIFGEEIFESDLLPIKFFNENELKLIKSMLSGNFNTNLTSSAGRIFDGVASILGLYQKITFEGQAAMALEFIIEDNKSDDYYDFEIIKSVNEKFPDSNVVDWTKLIKSILNDMNENVSKGIISIKFHNTLVKIIVSIAKLAKEEKVILTGGCFQNRYLLEQSVLKLREEGFTPYWHKTVPSNDGGISLGQIVAVTGSN